MGRRGPPEGRSRLERQRLKERTWEFANAGMSTSAIAEHLDVSVRTVQRWRRQIVPTGKEPKMDVVFQDIGDIRAKAYLATAMAEIDPAKRAERNYWWDAYIPILRVLLRAALQEDRGSSIAPQFIVEGLNQWYADLRALRRMTPPLAQSAPEVPPVEELPSETVCAVQHPARPRLRAATRNHCAGPQRVSKKLCWLVR